MKQISSFMSEISDEFKIVVVDAIRLVNAMSHAKKSYFTVTGKILACCACLMRVPTMTMKILFTMQQMTTLSSFLY